MAAVGDPAELLTKAADWAVHPAPEMRQLACGLAVQGYKAGRKQAVEILHRLSADEERSVRDTAGRECGRLLCQDFSRMLEEMYEFRTDPSPWVRRAVAIAAVTAGSILLTLNLSGRWGISTGALLVAAACLMWRLDNNLTRHISLKDPKRIVAIKGLVAGGFSAVLAVALGRPFPGVRYILLGLLLGSVSYGISIVLFVRALRHLGAARTGALFGTAPFIGAAISLVVFRDLPTLSFFLSLPLLGIGAGILFSERHRHPHAHQLLMHTHAHTHDDGHHEHTHAREIPLDYQHSHQHVHAPTTHTHSHRPDIHHRHAHKPSVEEATW